MPASSEPKNEVWTKTFRAIEFAALARASFKPGCKNHLSMTPQYSQLCPKLDSIPDVVIEAAALLYLKRYLSEDAAREAISFWSTTRGRDLNKKILREIETGIYGQLSAADLEMLEKVNRTAYGRALYAFSADKEQGAAVARAMINYVP